MDGKLARLHLSRCTGEGQRDKPLPTPKQRQRNRRAKQVQMDYPQCLDAMARNTRSQMPARDVLIESFSCLSPSISISTLLHQLEQGDDITDALTNAPTQDSSEIRFLHLVLQSLVGGLFVPYSLEQAASLLRDEHRQEKELEAATAQARLSAHILTLLPFVVLAILLACSATTRRAIFLTPSLIMLCIGVVLNRIGWQWIRHLIERTRTYSPDVSTQLAEVLCVALPAGIPNHHAIEKWASQHDAILQHSLVVGLPLAEALREFSHRVGGNAEPLVHMLLTADRDGLPIAHTINQLTTELRLQRRHHTDVQLRQLPTKLSMPVVFLVLPSFVLLTVMPLIVANFTHFQFSPPPITTPL